jgi:hypothetical protein
MNLITDSIKDILLTAAGLVLPRESKWDHLTDSKGFRILKNQVIDLQQRLQDEVVSILKDSIIYEDGGSKLHAYISSSFFYGSLLDAAWYVFNGINFVL